MKNLILSLFVLGPGLVQAGTLQCTLKEISERPPVENMLVAQDVNNSGYYGIALKGERFKATIALNTRTDELDLEIKDGDKVVTQTSTRIQKPLDIQAQAMTDGGGIAIVNCLLE